MYFSWIWQSPESLLGVMTANTIVIVEDEDKYTASLISLGIILCRVDFIINKEKIND